jgi:hypothetical protein
LFFSLKKTRFFGFNKDNNNSKAKKKKTNLFFSYILFFLTKKGKTLPELRGLVLRPKVYN